VWDAGVLGDPDPSLPVTDPAAIKMRFASLGACGPDFLYALMDYGPELQDLENILVKTAATFDGLADLMSGIQERVDGVVHSPDDVVAIAKCLLAGQWGPWWDDPFGSGWIPGFKVCIGHDCADALGIYLLRFFAPGPGSLLSALKAGIQAGSVSAGIASMASGFSMWVAVCTFVTGFEITAANSGNAKRGVCLYCSWPWVGIPIFAVSR
jgi:hypothetical protein